MKPMKEIDFMIIKRWISDMKQKFKSNLRDMLWGILWSGWVVVPILYVILAKEKSGRLQ
jgi:hypothetical protein